MTYCRLTAVMVAAAALLASAIALYAQTPPAKKADVATETRSKPTPDRTRGDADGKTPAVKTRDDALGTQRFELIQRHVATAEIRSDKAGFPTQFVLKPLFKYNDPARGHVAAAVFKLGDKGRPKAILTSELDRFNNGRPTISHEYTSLTPTRFSVTLDTMHWTPASTQYEFKPIPAAPEPEKTPARRLIQLRELAKRFAGHEVVAKEKCELRLLPQPVDRYVPSDAERADGAIFFFTFGTNPEVMLLMESDGEQWTYAAGRMTGAEEVVLTFDDKIAWQGTPLLKGSDSPYTGSIAPIDIPGIAPDGREIAE